MDTEPMTTTVMVTPCRMTHTPHQTTLTAKLDRTMLHPRWRGR